MSAYAKVAVSLPSKTLKSLDAARRRLGRSRSAVVSQAIEEWLTQHSEPSEDERRYAEGYLRQPEATAEVAAIAAAATATWERWK